MLLPFAQAIVFKTEVLAAALTPRRRAAVLASISVDIRQYGDIAGPEHLVPLV
jgi:hypothetical protein